MTELQSIVLRQEAWYGDTEFAVSLPASWDVTVCRMRGHDRPPLREEGIRAPFSHPIGSLPIRELARGKKQVAILFDDLARPTPVHEIIPFVLEELAIADIPDESIRFICAQGAHRALMRLDFAKKLGEEVLDRFPVYSHNPYENCDYVGTTSRGTPVAINKEVLNCDLKIGMGGIYPHSVASFSGGGKIILPGVASIDTIQTNHSLARLARQAGRSISFGTGFEENELRMDIAEAAQIAGLDIKIDALLNDRREIIALFVGEPLAEHIEGVRVAKEVYATDPVPGGVEVAISNAYGKGTESYHAVPIGTSMLREAGGDLVVISNSPEGIVPHYLMGAWGEDTGGRFWQRRRPLPPKTKRFILVSKYLDRAQSGRLAPLGLLTWCKTWAEALDVLRQDYPYRAKVAVIPDGTIQYVPAQ